MRVARPAHSHKRHVDKEKLGIAQPIKPIAPYGSAPCYVEVTVCAFHYFLYALECSSFQVVDPIWVAVVSHEDA